MSISVQHRLHETQRIHPSSSMTKLKIGQVMPPTVIHCDNHGGGDHSHSPCFSLRENEISVVFCPAKSTDPRPPTGEARRVRDNVIALGFHLIHRSRRRHHSTIIVVLTAKLEERTRHHQHTTRIFLLIHVNNNLKLPFILHHHYRICAGFSMKRESSVYYVYIDPKTWRMC